MQGFMDGKSTVVWNSDVHAGTVVLNSAYIPRLAVQRLQSEGSIVEIQRIDTGTIQLYYSRASIANTITATLYGNEACVLLHIVLAGSLTHTTKQAGEKTLHTGQYCVFYTAGHDISISIEAAQQLVVMDILLPADTVLAQLAMYPAHISFREKIKRKEACYLSDEALYMHAGLYDIVTRLLFAPYNDTLHAFYEELCSILLREMFLSVMRNGQQSDEQQKLWIQSMHAIKAFIDAHIKQHYSIAVLCKRAGINAKQLKTGFKALFGYGVYAYLKMKRMEAAYEAVLQPGQTLKYIATASGYKSTGSFIKAFKKHFGKTPGVVRKGKSVRNT